MLSWIYCNNNSDDKNNSIKLFCNHSYHNSCIKLWLKQKSNCPNCRKDINIWNYSNQSYIYSNSRTTIPNRSADINNNISLNSMNNLDENLDNNHNNNENQEEKEQYENDIQNGLNFILNNKLYDIFLLSASLFLNLILL